MYECAAAMTDEIGIAVRWLTRYGPEGASSRYRVYQYLDDLEGRGIRSAVEPLAPWKAGRFRQLCGVAARIGQCRIGQPPDAVVIQKEPIMPPNAWPAIRRLLSRASIPIVWDIDDAVWIGRRGAMSMAHDMAAMASVVVAGNSLLAEWASSVGASDVRIVPTCFSPPDSPTRSADRSDLLELLWIGSPSTARLLEAEHVHLERILSNPRVRLTMVGGSPPDDLASAHPVRQLAWSPESEHDCLSKADFGLALQPRGVYADHKCGFKIVQYMAYGVIPIATDNQVHRRIMGGFGSLISPDTDPAAAVAPLLTAEVAEADREAVREHWRANYSRDVGVEAWARLLHEIAR